MAYFCSDCGWHPCRCLKLFGLAETCESCGTGLLLRRNGGGPSVSCPSCHTHWPLQPTGRPPIVASYPDGARRLFCPCGMVLLHSPGSEAPRRCPGCQCRYRWPGDPEPTPAAAQPARAPFSNFEERKDHRVPISALTDLVCMHCGHVIARIRHAWDTPCNVQRYAHARCQVCKGPPLRGDTDLVFGFVGEYNVALRPDDRTSSLGGQP